MGRAGKKAKKLDDDEQAYNEMMDKTSRLREVQIAKVTQEHKKRLQALKERIEQKQRHRFIKQLEKRLGKEAAAPFIAKLAQLEESPEGGQASRVDEFDKTTQFVVELLDEDGSDSDLTSDEEEEMQDQEDQAFDMLAVDELDEEDAEEDDDDDEKDLLTLKPEFPTKDHFASNYLLPEELNGMTSPSSSVSKLFSVERLLQNVYGQVDLSEEEETSSDDLMDGTKFVLPEGLKRRLQRSFVTKDPNTRDSVRLPRRQRNLLTCLSTNLGQYKDVWATECDFQSIQSARILAATHIGTHVYNAQFRFWSNNLDIKQKALSNKHAMSVEGDDVYRDGGFTKPRALIISPTCQSIKDIVEVLMSLKDKWVIPSRSRFGFFCGSISREEYERLEPEEISALAYFRESGEELKKKKKPVLLPEDFVSYFRGNNNDSMVIGLRFTKNALHLCCELPKADIIIGTITGLKGLILEGGVYQRGGPAWPRGHPKTRLYPDSLCSIEMLMLDRAEMLESQDRTTLNAILASINASPKEEVKQDIRRIHAKFLDDGLPQRYRQNIILSKGIPSDTTRFFLSGCDNFRGREVIAFEREKGVVGLGKIILPHSLRLYSKMVKFCALNKNAQKPDDENAASESDIEEVSDDDLDEDAYEEKLFHDLLLKKFALPLSEQEQCVVIVLRDVLSFYNLVAAIDTARGHLGPLDYQCLHEDVQDPEKAIRQAYSRMANGKLSALIVTERFLLYNAPRFKGYDHLLFWGSPTHEYVATQLLEGLPKDSGAESDRKSLCATFCFEHEPHINQRWQGI